MAKMKLQDWLAISLLTIGGIEWGLYAMNKSWGIVQWLFDYSTLARVIYGVVGVSALYSVWFIIKQVK